MSNKVVKISAARAAVLKAKTSSIASKLPATRNADGSVKPRDKTGGKATAKPAAAPKADEKASAPQAAPAPKPEPSQLAPVKAGNGQHPATIAQAAAGPATIEGETVKQPVKDAVAEALAPAQLLDLPMKYLAAALSIAPQDDSRYYLNGVYVHQLEDLAVRLVATDGHRLFVCSFARETEIAWARKGAILPAEELQRIVRYLGKKAPAVRVEFGVGHPSMKVQEIDGMGSFQVKAIDGEFPDYQRVVDAAAAVFSAEREEMSLTQIDSKYLKAAGALAAQLESRGVIPFLAEQNSSAASVFAFAEVPEALLYIMSQRTADKQEALPAPTVKLFGEAAMRQALVNLEAQVKRTRENAKAAKHEKFRVQFEQKADRLQLRIDQLRANLAPKLAAPAPAPKAEATAPASVAVH